MKKILFSFVAVAIFSTVALADIRLPDTPKPKPSKSIDTYLSIRIKRDATEARLIIPKSQIKQLRAQLEQLENGDDTNAALTDSGAAGWTRTQTIVSGLFMSLAFVFGGFWLVRSRKVSTTAGKVTIAGAVLFLSASVASIAFANAGPPAEARTITGKMFAPSMHIYKFGGGRIKLETATDNTQNIELIVPDVKDDKPAANKEE